MKAPRFAVISIALDTEAYRLNVRPEVRDGHAVYLLDRLLTGEEVADTALEQLGWKVTIRPAFKKEIRTSRETDDGSLT
jgi:hypothetical protein